MALAKEHLFKSILSKAKELDFNSDKPFPFLLDGNFKKLNFHVINGQNPKFGGHGSKEKFFNLAEEERVDQLATVVGFYSASNQGTYTHPGESWHLHTVIEDQNIRELGEENICTSIIVASELRFGAEKKGSEILSQRINTILSAIEVIAYDTPADFQYAVLRSFLEKNGTLIDPNDMLIAAQARSLNLIVVTANTAEFSRVPDLVVENWL